MPVHHQEFVYPMIDEALDQVLQDGLLCTWIHIEGQLNISLPGVDPNGNGGQYDNFSSLFPGQPGSFMNQGIGFKIIRPIR